MAVAGGLAARTANPSAHAGVKRPRTPVDRLRNPRRTGPIPYRLPHAAAALKPSAHREPGGGGQVARCRCGDAPRKPRRGPPPDQRRATADPRRVGRGGGRRPPGVRIARSTGTEGGVSQQGRLRPAPPSSKTPSTASSRKDSPTLGSTARANASPSGSSSRAIGCVSRSRTAGSVFACRTSKTAASAWKESANEPDSWAAPRRSKASRAKEPASSSNCLCHARRKTTDPPRAGSLLAGCRVFSCKGLQGLFTLSLRPPRTRLGIARSEPAQLGFCLDSCPT